jgi:hypothetical protein
MNKIKTKNGSFRGITMTKIGLENLGFNFNVYNYRAKDVSGIFGPDQIFYVIDEFAITPNNNGSNYFLFEIKKNPQIKLQKIDN